MFVQGMNLKSTWSVQQSSDLLFWEIAIPMTAVIVTVFFWSEFDRAFERLKKKMQQKKIDRVSLDSTPLAPPCPLAMTTDSLQPSAQTGLNIPYHLSIS